VEEEIIIIVTRKQAQRLSEAEAANLTETSQGLVRQFSGHDRFKRALKFLRALDTVTEE
jgi:hypothetical protein